MLREPGLPPAGVSGWPSGSRPCGPTTRATQRRSYDHRLASHDRTAPRSLSYRRNGTVATTGRQRRSHRSLRGGPSDHPGEPLNRFMQLLHTGEPCRAGVHQRPGHRSGHRDDHVVKPRAGVAAAQALNVARANSSCWAWCCVQGALKESRRGRGTSHPPSPHDSQAQCESPASKGTGALSKLMGRHAAPASISVGRPRRPRDPRPLIGPPAIAQA